MSTRVLAVASAIAALAVLAAGCGGGASSGSATGATSFAAIATTGQTGALAFARCLRSHGLPNWPDPTSSGVFDKSQLRQIGYSVSRVRAVEDGPCKDLLNTVAAPRYTITPADRTDYLKAAACMRAHGFPGFPDPTFQDDNVETNIPSSIDQDSARFKSAAETCTRVIPAGLPYSRPSGS